MLNRKKGKKLAEKGFTLIELLITVVILGTLSAIAVPGFIKYQKQGVVGANNAEAMALAKACSAKMATPGETFGSTDDCQANGGTFEVDKDDSKATAATTTTDSEGGVELTTASEPVE